MRRTLRLLLLPLLLPLAPMLAAQEAEPWKALDRTQWAQVRTQLAAATEALGPMLRAIDTEDAERWLAQSPEEQLAAQAEAAEGPAKPLWTQALEVERASIQRIQGALERAEAARALPRALEETSRRLQRELPPLLEPVPAERTISELEETWTQLSRQRERAALELGQRQATLEGLREQLKAQSIPLEPPRGQPEAPPASIPNPGDDPALEEARAALEAAQQRQASARLIAAQLDAQSLPPRVRALDALTRALALERNWLNARIAQVEQEINDRSSEELRALREELAWLLEREPDADSRFPEEIRSLRERFDRIARTQTRIRQLQEERARYARIEEDLRQTLANVRERLEVSGLTQALGGLFLEEQRRLRDLEELRFTVTAIEQEITESRLRGISLREALATAQPSGLEPAQAQLRSLRQQALESQLQAEQTLTAQLQQADAHLRAAIRLLDELQQILRETLLWWPSHVPVGKDWALAVPVAVVALFEPDSWKELGRALVAVTWGSPIPTLLTLLGVGALLAWGRGTPARLAELARQTEHRFTDHIRLTFRALGWSLIRALPIPTLLMATALRLQALPEAGYGVEILGTMLFSAAVWWLAGHLLLLFTRSDGVGVAHFGWPELLLHRVRRDLTWFLPAQLLLILFLALAFGHPEEAVFNVFGRLGLLAAAVLVGLLGWRLLAPPPKGARPLLEERKRRFLRLLILAAILALVLLCLGGYLLTVGELLDRIVDTAVVLGAVWLAHSLAARALILSETRLLIRRMREQRAKAAGESTAGAEGGLDLPERHLSLEDVNQQTRTLLHVITGGGVFIALFWVWSDMLPALTWLDGVTLWSRSIQVDGTEVLSRVSLQDFFMAIFLGILFTLAARNLPGLVEILLARSTRMDAAGRYTVTMLLRYLMAVIAVVSVFSLLGLRWSELQWMVAALTLGLGFGLQEVVANFVSGLIVLLERPVRVGDTVTIGEYSGTVARIRTRATTIIDWDNKEVVVPNKNFITERLINWTLSDTTTRVVIPVGVSYDSDVDKVREKLLEVAAKDPHVMDDPAPSVYFLRFGNSTLDFELRVYVNQLRDRLDTISDLHTAIIKCFRREGIEIAFPQMDLHVRDLAQSPGTHTAPGELPGQTGTPDGG
ncbi:potassium efflux system protein [Ectothiorhodospira mobilis]|uniref:Potassium efflux system protein n=1 Tax=Ectothiorhodospira mobilis TaxID=195064 RepID=A0A1I4PG36_ECTMO|nr:mechanosensitive ion channel domain-containing protein [Ectothiorhodospira mobilis]SFM26600.1 potassium efflux system protein [Ectothiorhodospira mobilis]